MNQGSTIWPAILPTVRGSCPLPPDADRRRAAPSYYILINLGQRDEPFLKCSQSQNDVALKAANDSEKMHVDFRYLEPRQGFNVELLVTGEVKGDLHPTGIIMGMPAGFRKFDERSRRTIAQVVLFGTLFIVLVVNIVGTTQFPDNMFIKKGSPFIFWGVAVLTPIFAVRWSRGIFWRQGVPRDLRT